jgi:hypothetical protein
MPPTDAERERPPAATGGASSGVQQQTSNVTRRRGPVYRDVYDTSRDPFWRDDLLESLRDCITVLVTDGEHQPVNIGWHPQPWPAIRKRLVKRGIDVQ